MSQRRKSSHPDQNYLPEEELRFLSMTEDIDGLYHLLDKGNCK